MESLHLVNRKQKERDAMQPKRYASDKDLSKRYKVSRATPWNWVKAGKFPKPKKLGPNTTRWDMDEVERYEAERGMA